MAKKKSKRELVLPPQRIGGKLVKGLTKRALKKKNPTKTQQSSAPILKKGEVSEKLVLSSLGKTIPKTVALYNKSKSSEKFNGPLLLGLAFIELLAFSAARMENIKNENKAMLDKLIKESKKLKKTQKRTV